MQGGIGKKLSKQYGESILNYLYIMSASYHLGEKEPLCYLGEFPVRLITLLVAFHSAAMIAVTLLAASGHGVWLDVLAYKSTAVAHGQIWRLVTYAFLANPDIWFLFEMLMLYYFGKEVENGLGWRRFGILYAGLILLGPMLLQAFGYAGIPQVTTGAQEVDFAIFAAFVAMHPKAQFFFGMAARWVFVALLAISSLQLLAAHQAPRILVLISSCVMAITLMRRAGFTEELFGWSFQWSLPGLSKSQSSFSVVPGGLSASARRQKNATKTHGINPEEVLDRLLEKISSKGIGSLSADERTALEQARQALLLREGGHTS